jgi:hypothetical protein
MIKECKEVHGGVFSSRNINWQNWANNILSLNILHQADTILKPPPPNLVHLFLCGNSHQQVVQICESLSFVKDLLDGAGEQLQAITGLSNELVCHIKGFETFLLFKD